MTQPMIDTLEKKYGKLSYYDKKIDVIAGLRQSSLKKVGYKVVRFFENVHGQLVAEFEIKRVIF